MATHVIHPKTEIGQRYGRLVVIAAAEKRRYKGRTYSRWLCRCDCGTEKVIEQAALHAGLTQSCGCFRKERVLETIVKHGRR